MRPGYGSRHPGLLAILDETKPTAVDQATWSPRTQLRVTAFVDDGELPDGLVASVRWLVEVDGRIVVVEIKGHDRAEQEDVKQKAEAARRWVNEVSADEKTDREWKYLLVTQSRVVQAKGTSNAMKALGT